MGMINGSGVWTNGCAALLFLGITGCGAESAEHVGSSSEALGDDDAEVLGFESLQGWTASYGAGPELSDVASQGAHSLSVTARGHSTYTSRPIALTEAPVAVRYDLRLSPEVAGKWRGQTQLFLQCAEKNVHRAFVGARDLDELSLGVFEQTRFVVKDSLRKRLAGGCSRAVIEIVLNTPSDAPVLLDNLTIQTRPSQVTMANAPQCGLPSTAGLVAAAQETAEGHWDYQDWALGRNAQIEQQRLGSVLAPFPGYLAPAHDHVNRQVVVAVDALEGDGEQIRAAIEREEIDLPVTIQPTCLPLATLRGAQQQATRRDWHPSAKSIAFGAFQDSNSGRLLATFSAADADVASALAALLGDAVRIELGQPSRLGRLDDGQPHFGGSAIGTLNNNFCTSAFTVLRSGVRGAFTAAHCNFVPGTSIYSGPKLYGLAVDPGLFPTYDLFRIDPNGQTFTNTIHTDPCCPVARKITTKGNPDLNSSVCFSGHVTRAKCGITVTALGQPWCDPNGCTTNLAVGERAGVTIGQPGDSGGPVYSPVAGGEFAAARGMIVARDTPSRVYFHIVSDIESRLGVTIATN